MSKSLFSEICFKWLELSWWYFAFGEYKGIEVYEKETIKQLQLLYVIITLSIFFRYNMLFLFIISRWYQFTESDNLAAKKKKSKCQFKNLISSKQKLLTLVSCDEQLGKVQLWNLNHFFIFKLMFLIILDLNYKDKDKWVY